MSAFAVSRPRTLAVIGAGPIGLAAALGALQRGLDVTVLEQGDVGDALLRWGGVRMFSPLEMNVPAAARRILQGAIPAGEALLTGPELVRQILRPLASSPPLAGRVLARHRVLSVGRAGLTRDDLPGHPLRAERPFRLLASTPDGDRVFEVDRVLDASGVYDQPSGAGCGGQPARGESAAAGRLIRHLGDLELAREKLSGANVLLVGQGHSAANALLTLTAMAREEPRTRITWVARSPNRRPCAEVADDPLPERRRVVSHANDLAADPPAFLKVERRASLESIEPDRHRIRATLTTGHAGTFDTIVALTGYRPDLGMLSELPLEISPVTEGTAGLARTMIGATDCLASPRLSIEDLRSGEPGFYLVGSKSYGRLNTFLLKTGLSHLETILEDLSR